MKYKVLIVEDDEDAASIEAVMLREMDLDVEVVGHGDQAIPKMKEWQPHVVVLDLELPGQSGVQILQQMTLDPTLRDLIIIANSVHIDAKDDLGLAYYVHYQRVKNEEPVMVNKLSNKEEKDLTSLIGIMIGQKFGQIPRPMGDYLDKMEKKRKQC